MKILLTGHTGMIGTALKTNLRAHGHQIVTLGRSPQSTFRWDPEHGVFPTDSLDGVETVIHLAGETLAKRWTSRQKQRILKSRENGTRLLANAIAASARPPRTFLSASAVGYYGSRGDIVLTESSGPGVGFLSDLCATWENACQPAVDRGVRVVHLRMSIILSTVHGVLHEMLPAFQWGMGGVIGSGRQYLGWVSLQDTMRAIQHILTREDIVGPVNITSPRPVRMSEWVETLGRVLSRPVFVKTPVFILRALIGECVDGLLLSSQKVIPEKLTAAGFVFRDPDFERALRSAFNHTGVSNSLGFRHDKSIPFLGREGASNANLNLFDKEPFSSPRLENLVPKQEKSSDN